MNGVAPRPEYMHKRWENGDIFVCRPERCAWPVKLQWIVGVVLCS